MDARDPRLVLERLVAQSGEGFAALSRMLGRNEAYLQQFVRRGTPRRLAERDRLLLANYLGVPEEVLGGPIRAAPVTSVAVRRLAATASAGPGGLAEDDRMLGLARFDEQVLARLGVRAESVSVLRAEGDSMQPMIEDGDEMLVDETDRSSGARPAIFVLRLDSMLIVKSVSMAGKLLRVSSMNASYPDVPLQHPDAVDIVGKVVWLSRALR